jgi:5-(carboxyamino)imidazole ribonucleotide mutase
MKVAIVMGSTSDLSIMKEAGKALKDFGVSFHIEIVSAHRTPDKMVQFARSAVDQGFQIIIAGAGGAAHLPGMVASLTTLPVIGVPIQIGKLKGLDALLSIVQMPKGIPVATVAVDNGWNAGLLAVRILGAQNPRIHQKLLKYEKTLAGKVKKMNQELKAGLKRSKK